MDPVSTRSDFPAEGMAINFQGGWLLRARGAAFLTPPHESAAEIRCFFRDPDGHLFEVSERK
jgi:catechol 2,3-dioxygenase-like lactoylglutathione lyase family enzyme